jgi:hypothetical protein
MYLTESVNAAGAAAFTTAEINRHRKETSGCARVIHFNNAALA